MIMVISSIEYDLDGNVIYNDNLESMIDDDVYFEMTIASLLLWTLGSVFIGIIVCGGGLVWYKMYSTGQFTQNKDLKPNTT